MDFFTQQDRARRHSFRLVGLFVLAVLALILITNLAVAATFGMLLNNTNSATNFYDYFNWQSFINISLGVSGVIGCAIAFKWWQLGSGGRAVAESLGGERIAPNSNDDQQRRILNVVDEMALAANMPVPPVYLLAHEPGINAFAAGNTPADAVIGITAGALQQFNRDQLQGVIAHEFSHILNGDMRLNIRLIALLHGILFIGMMGEFLIHGSAFSSRNRDSDNKGAQLGLIFIVIGWLGGFFGRLIKAAVSRQREFLADASAVQFTRNPDGIADALKIIGGYSPGAELNNPNSEQASHLFFGQALKKLRPSFATHPSLDERIKRIQPYWDGRFIIRASDTICSHAENTDKSNSHTENSGKSSDASDLMGGAATFIVNTAAHQAGTTAQLRHQLREPLHACAFVYALLLDDNADLRQQQLNYIPRANIVGLDTLALQLKPIINALPQASRLPLIETAMPALKCMSPEQYRTYKKVMLLLIRCDQQYTMLEWCLFQLVNHYMESEFNSKSQSKAKYKRADDVAEAFQTVLSVLAKQGHDDDNSAEQAFNRGASTAGLHNIKRQSLTNFQFEDFIKAANQLANCYPLLKPKLIKGFVDCARYDTIISADEQEIIAALSAVMDCPSPSLT
ncbi:Zn-dependent protease with chaperone function [Sinobacterium caligoides]|uniref:Zn-dependent protease with chaperone function n=1 Tax=Sinobacterium caligoides TaxID=933926 RepID=A0A3N2DN45_9GAMM|nr:M48 family metallopeptidase [Sinobacterium caligoides]ROS01231.1 Zn-dependent protease with chaperone function [Sinobacterium caligoides]